MNPLMPPTDFTFKLTVRDSPGVLVRIAQIFARRGCNIRYLDVKPRAGDQWSDITIVAHDVSDAPQITRHLEKLIDVQSVTTHEYLIK